MSEPLKPVKGRWYRNLAEERFEVIAFDDDGVAIQYEDGIIEEFDIVDWDEAVGVGEIVKDQGPATWA